MRCLKETLPSCFQWSITANFENSVFKMLSCFWRNFRVVFNLKKKLKLIGVFHVIYERLLFQPKKFSEHFAKFVFVNGSPETFCRIYFSELPQTTTFCRIYFCELGLNWQNSIQQNNAAKIISRINHLL